MDKVGRPRRLIGFDTLAAQEAQAAGVSYRHPWIRTRPMIYGVVLLAVAVGMALALVLRSDTELHVLRDRSPLFVQLSDGAIRNGYTIKILNKARQSRSYLLSVQGLPDARLTVVGGEEPSQGATVRLSARPDSVASYRVYVAARSPGAESTVMTFRLVGDANGAAASHVSSFTSPKG